MEPYKLTEEQQYERAQKRAREIKSFYYNLMCYCVVIPILIVLNLIYSPQYLWFLFSMFGWGIGLFLHAMGAFDFNPFLGKKWEEKKLLEIIEKEKARQERIKNKL